MYIITFYSFKGGVGRTMALANVAFQLAETGRRVLLVDFDLEAPGLDTFEILKPPAQTPGVVDFITEFRETGIAPEVSRFVYKASDDAAAPSDVWIMPTGRQDGQYASRLYSIDWSRLYEEHDGYILFEDLKEQWRRTLKADYVLIDSRTGHTDVGGICTRQLPDAVAIFFFPNEQNRRGIEVVANDIRREKQETKRPIQLYFVAANLPNLDDEEGILRDRLNRFRRTLDYPELDGTIHHYDSLALLEQTIFTAQRPQTRLAREYRRLTERLISDNLADRVVTLSLLSRLGRGASMPKLSTVDSIQELLKKIHGMYRCDGEVLFSMSQTHRYLGNTELAERLLLEASANGFESAESASDRATELYRRGESVAARTLLANAVRPGTAGVFSVARIFNVVIAQDPEFLIELTGLLDKSKFPAADRLRLASTLMSESLALPAASKLLVSIMDGAKEASEREKAAYELSLCRIAQHRFDDAMELITPDRSLLESMGIGENFNYAMAEWGACGRLPVDLFRRVLQIHSDSPRDSGANYYQCIAIALWANQQIDQALGNVALSRAVVDDAERVFTAWRYLYVNKDQFLEDLSSLERMIQGDDSKPEILAEPLRWV